jgi:ABC-type transport system involved in multi-copper enzyme maturation permease subunit
MNRKRFLAGIWPVAQRELREGARGKGNRRMRFWSALAGTLVLWFVLANTDEPEAELGFDLFVRLHITLVGLILLVVPCLTADCLAREKREGTLGLLFLTPLSAGGIVAGKALTQALRASTLWLAMAPVLTIPFLTGGVTWQDALGAVTAEFCVALLCFGSGLLASSLVQKRNAAFVLAFVFAAFFVYLFSEIAFLVLLVSVHGLSFLNFLDYQIWEVMSFNLDLLTNGWVLNWTPPPLTLMGTITAPIWMWVSVAAPLAALWLFTLIFRFAARRVERSWHDKIPSPKRERLLQRYCTPVFRRRFDRAMQRSLDWNPVAWLQQYSWKDRITKWGLCLVCILVEIGVLGAAGIQALPATQALLLAGLAAVYIFVGVNTFLEEKRSGALELLLVTPISVNKLIFGRAWGLWKQFLPSVLVVAAVINWPGLRLAWWYGREEPSVCSPVGQVWILCNFLTLPIFATYAALRLKNQFAAAALTVVGSYLSSIFALMAVGAITSDDWLGYDVLLTMATAIFYAAFALLTCFLLRHSLSRRIYSF